LPKIAISIFSCPLLPALAIHHLLTSGEIPEAQFAEQVVNDVILPLATAPTGVRHLNKTSGLKSAGLPSPF